MNDLSTAPLLPGRLAASTAKVFVTDQTSEDVLRQALIDVGVNDAEFTRGTVETAIAALAKQASPRLLIVDLTGIQDPFARIDELAARCEPEVDVVAIGDRNDIILYRQLRNLGVTEYFFKPLSRDLVKRVCNTILSGTREDKTVDPRSGKLVFVLGVRGGVGATTIAVNAALRLANTGQRWVMLVDLDMECGDAALQLGAMPTSALHEAVEKPERVDKLFLERGTLHAGERLDLLASLEPLGRSIALNDVNLQALIDRLLQRYRFVFIDLPAPIAANLIEVLRRPSTCVLVSDASLSSARDLVRWRDLLGPNSPNRRTTHLLNKGGADGSLPEAEFVGAIGRAPDLTIPYDRGIAAASTLGAKAVQKSAVLNRGLGNLLRDLAGEAAEPPKSVFSRIFG